MKNKYILIALVVFICLSSRAHAADPAQYGLQEGWTISAAGSDDPDIYIVNEQGYKRLFLNPIIFSFYGHLGGFIAVHNVSASTRDAFPTSGLFRNCETNDPKVYGVEVTGEDSGTLHWLNESGTQAVAEDQAFFNKVFCINNNEFNWYAKGADYTSVSQVPNYQRVPEATPTPTQTGSSGSGQCQGTGSVQFGASPFRLDQIELIEPMGQMIGGHVTPIDHGYIFGHGTPNIPPDTFDIQSPVKGYVTELSRTNRGSFIDHAMTIEFSCTFFVHYSNMSSFSPKLMNVVGTIGENEWKYIRVPVEEGELVGKTGPYGIDLSVWDLNLTLPGFVNPTSYYNEGWKLHSAQFYDYVKEPLKTQLLAKTPRQAEPRFGKIDYDIDGRLVGNWFQEGTNGYAGSTSTGGGTAGGEYWSGHLAIAYDAWDPRGIIVSIGNWPNGANQFGVRNNTPDPKDVSIETGLVKYELLPTDLLVVATGERWDRRTYAQELQFKPIDATQGVILVQLVESRKLKVEIFPGKTAGEVSGFTSNALIYER